MKFVFISEEKVAFPVAVLCRLLAVSPSGFYATQAHGMPGRRLAMAGMYFGLITFLLFGMRLTHIATN